MICNTFTSNNVQIFKSFKTFKINQRIKNIDLKTFLTSRILLNVYGTTHFFRKYATIEL